MTYTALVIRAIPCHTNLYDIIGAEEWRTGACSARERERTGQGGGGGSCSRSVGSSMQASIRTGKASGDDGGYDFVSPVSTGRLVSKPCTLHPGQSLFATGIWCREKLVFIGTCSVILYVQRGGLGTRTSSDTLMSACTEQQVEEIVRTATNPEVKITAQVRAVGSSIELQYV